MFINLFINFFNQLLGNCLLSTFDQFWFFDIQELLLDVR